MDDRNSVTITLRGGLVEAALVWLQDGKKSSVLAAASKQGSGHIKDCVAGLEVPWPFLCRLSFLSLFFLRVHAVRFVPVTPCEPQTYLSQFC